MRYLQIKTGKLNLRNMNYYINGTPSFDTYLIRGSAVGVSNNYWTSECYNQDYDDGAYGLYSDRAPAALGLLKRGAALPVLCIEE
ncbi:MAG: hypothetical protein EOM31_02725 [Bacteroidia bacterium]|nr:hypothetical protein [Bacteroidia bacterium]